jgi:microcystin-dependent protein
MSEPFVGQLMLASFNFAPKGFSMCNGQLLAINSNQALFSLLGTTFGGDGRVTFGLPNLQGRTPVGAGTGTGITVQWGEMGGQEFHTLNMGEVPPHSHALKAAPTANSPKPSGASPAGQVAAAFTGLNNPGAMNQATLTPIGGNQPHENRQPYLVMTWVIALVGIFPTRS